MLLRKHLTGAKITAISQPPVERVLEIWFDAPDTMGVFTPKCLTVELIKSKANIILQDKEGIIIDCLRRIGGELDGKRMVLPGLIYRPPAVQTGKTDPTSLSPSDWQNLFDSASQQTVDSWLISSFAGLSPLVCRELSWRAYRDTDISIGAVGDGGQRLEKEFFSLMDAVRENKFEPHVVTGADGALVDFSYTPVSQYESTYLSNVQADFNTMLDYFYTKKAQTDRGRQRASATIKAVKTARDRTARKLALQYEELKKVADREVLREHGDIITANLHTMQKGQRFLEAYDFYCESDGATRKITLDPLKTPQQNAAKYYKNYTKTKNAEKFLIEQISSGERELEYLESVLETLLLADTMRDLAEIRDELTQTGYLKKKKTNLKKEKAPVPMRFKSSSGLWIFAGRNNMQNDKLTLKTAAKTDMWLHTQKIHGCHVVISCGGAVPDEKTLSEAAAIAAYYSAARNAGKVLVDYTPVKNVKKIPGGRPGMVTYTNYKTLAAVPDENLVNKLRTCGQNPNIPVID
jgi:predicted ribosome quality control (RQC) complex YloA/Tae2 family protein